MANVKLTNKKKLEELQAKLVLQKGRKISQQEILDKCIEFSDIHFQEFTEEQIDIPVLNKEKIDAILANTYRGKTYFKDKTDDELIYEIKKNED
jgi:hypothetical protein